MREMRSSYVAFAIGLIVAILAIRAVPVSIKDQAIYACIGGFLIGLGLPAVLGIR